MSNGRGVDVRKFLVRPWPGGRHPEGALPGIGAVHMTEYHHWHQLMIILPLVILNNQPRGGTQQNAATGEGAALD